MEEQKEEAIEAPETPETPVEAPEAAAEEPKPSGIRMKFSAGMEAMKAKMGALKVKNQELMAKCKEQAAKIVALKNVVAAIQPIEKSKEIYADMKESLTIFKNTKKKHIIMYSAGGKTGYIRGIIKFRFWGFIYLKEASIVECNIEAPKVKYLNYIGDMGLPKKNIEMFLPDMANE
jgi:hypothetical protein